MVGIQEAEGSYGNILLGTTPKGKEIYMVRKYNKTVRFIEFGSGGQLPECLQGGFSSIQIAQDKVDAYLARLKKKDIDESGKELKVKAKAK
jgi:hypothetical protein